MPVGGGGIGPCSRGTVVSAATDTTLTGAGDVDGTLAASVAVASQLSGNPCARAT